MIKNVISLVYLMQFNTNLVIFVLKR